MFEVSELKSSTFVVCSFLCVFEGGFFLLFFFGGGGAVLFFSWYGMGVGFAAYCISHTRAKFVCNKSPQRKVPDNQNTKSLLLQLCFFTLDILYTMLVYILYILWYGCTSAKA